MNTGYAKQHTAAAHTTQGQRTYTIAIKPVHFGYNLLVGCEHFNVETERYALDEVREESYQKIFILTLVSGSRQIYDRFFSAFSTYSLR